jgi:DNA-binding NarL/FixJ family response regulator
MGRVDMNELQVLEHVAELCATSNSAAELCRKLVHSQVIGREAVGAVIYLVTQTGDLDLVGSYGKYPLLGEGVSIWSDNPISKAATTLNPQVSKIEANDELTYPVSAFPILKGTEPVGVISMLRTSDKYMISNLLPGPIVKTLGNTFGIWLDSLGLKPGNGNGNGNGNHHSSGDLTERQLEILRLMAAGKTNAQIASELILSESSIRQETVRIYRALGVGTRAEAARKGLNLGLIDRISI